MGESKPLPLPAAYPADAGHVTRLAGAFLIALDRLRPDPSQPRRTFDDAGLNDLTASIRERGIRQPIRVWHDAGENVYRIVSGERRFRAAQRAGLTHVPCILDRGEEGSATPDRTTVLLDQISENWQREDLNPYELSDALAELRDRHNLSQQELVRRTGKPKSDVSRLLAMQQVAPEVQQEIRTDTSKRFSRRHVVTLAQLPASDQHALLKRIKDENLSATETESAGRRMRTRSSGTKKTGTRVTVRRYSVGIATVEVRIRKGNATECDVLAALDHVRATVAADGHGDVQTNISEELA